MRARTGIFCALLAVAAALLLPALGSTARGAKSGKGLTTHISYTETNHGHLQGSSTVGIQGQGSFSAKLSGHAALEAAVLSLATGIPFTKIAQGGSYLVEHSDTSGVAVVSFHAHGLGTICVSYAAKHGKFVLGQSFLPTTGTLKSIGGTGTAAKWSGSAAFKQTALSGTSVEKFTFTGSAHGAVGKANKMTATCRRVAKLPGH